MEQRLSLVTLGVANLSASRGFYERLGWKASGIGGGEVAFFQAGGLVLALWGKAALTQDAGVEPGRGGFGGVALAHNVRCREEVDEVLAQAKAAGGTLLKGGEEKVWGGYGGYFADLDGYLWEVAWNPGFELRKDGTLIVPA
jgi:catechol 2,3-dioxygenase-like lactoylglutathione lyase family enzyme